jgi:hypothetical protein
MPDMQRQIDALREVFSADMRKPFVLKPTFPYGNPGALVNTTPSRPNVEGESFSYLCSLWEGRPPVSEVYNHP